MFGHNHNAYIWPSLLQEYKTCKKCKTQIKVRKICLSCQDFLAFDDTSAEKMNTLWGFFDSLVRRCSTA